MKEIAVEAQGGEKRAEGYSLERLIHWKEEYSLQGLLLKLKLQYFGHLMHAKN